MSDRHPVARARHTETEQTLEVVLRGGRLIAESVEAGSVVASFIDEDRISVDPRVSGPWQHFKGAVYEFKGLAKGPGGEALVLYRDSSGGSWLRPWSMVNEIVERDGYRGPRFVREKPA